MDKNKLKKGKLFSITEMVKYTLAGIDLEDKEDRDNIADELIVLSINVREKSIETLLDLMYDNGDITEQVYKYYLSKFTNNE